LPFSTPYPFYKHVAYSPILPDSRPKNHPQKKSPPHRSRDFFILHQLTAIPLPLTARTQPIPWIASLWLHKSRWRIFFQSCAGKTAFKLMVLFFKLVFRFGELINRSVQVCVLTGVTSKKRFLNGKVAYI
jgi:hypothetical protein